jgi:hypothetical protein
VQLTSRSRIGSVVGIIGALAISCQGTSGCITQPGGYQPPAYQPSVLLPRYVLVRVQATASTNIMPVPSSYGDSAGFQLRVDADTLFFNADSTYREAGQTTLVPVTGSPTPRPVTSGTPAPRYSGGGSVVLLPMFMGRRGTATYSGQSLTVGTSTGSATYGHPYFFYEAR